MLGEFLEKNAPDVSVQVVVKSNEDWGEYIDAVSVHTHLSLAFLVLNISYHNVQIYPLYCIVFQVCRSYGFYDRSCPFIYTLEGEHIGDGADFIEHVRNRYCRASIQMEKGN